MRGFPKITDYKKATLELGVVKNMTAITRRLILLNLANPYDRDAHKPYDLQILALEDGIPFWNGSGIDPRLLWQTSIDAESFGRCSGMEPAPPAYVDRMAQGISAVAMAVTKAKSSR
jgi:hypothetical protein